MHRMIMAAVLTVITGCAHAPQRHDAPAVPGPSAAQSPSILPVSYQEAVEFAPLPEPISAISGGALTLADLETIALASNPSVRQAQARVDAARGRWLQVGLRPNPVLGFSGMEIGNDGAAGQHGMFVAQQFVTHGKLHLNQHVVASEVEQAEQLAYAKELQVLTDVRLAYYDSLISQRRVEIAEDIRRVSQMAVSTIRHLVAGDQATRIDLLQAEVEAESAGLLVTNSRNNRHAAWRRLVAVLGTPERPLERLEGVVDEALPSIVWDDALLRLQSESPEVSAAVAAVERAQWAIDRACVEAKPNVDVLLGVSYDDGSDDVFSRVQVSVPIPIYDANQGGIQAARAQLMEAEHGIQRLELDLQRRLSAVFGRYANARQQARQYSEAILPKAVETLELVTLGYRAGEYPYLTLLTAQRTLFNARLSHLDALREIWAASVEVDGMLLTGSLSE